MDARQQVAWQRDFYSRTAADYDHTHWPATVGHDVSARLLLAWLPDLQVSTILDIGSGTGRFQRLTKELGTPYRITGIEPVAALREVGYRHGIPQDELIDGDATRLPFPDDSFDLVSAFGTMHHIPEPGRSVREMLRVAKVGVFISDSNNYGQGSRPLRLAKQVFWRSGLWPLIDRLRTRGKGFTLSEGDGLSYSYSVFNSLPAIREKFPNVFFMSTTPSHSGNLHVSAGTVAILATKERPPQPP
jgi:ubiquinone/menaquinone biosynthesis C-methylase UbiE